MTRRLATMCLMTIALIGFRSPVATGQSDNPNQGGKPSKEELSKLKANMPSDEEISELLAKADEKVSTFEKAVTSAKPHLDKFDTNQATNYLNAASTAHQLIQATKKNGPSAYRLIGVLATLDDLSVDAANGSAYLLAADEQQVLKGNAPDMHTQGAVIALITAGTACNDISELIFHATMRFVDAEEQILGQFLSN